MDSVLTSAVDRGFIVGIMDSVLTTSAVDRGFIGGVMDSVLTTSAVDRGFIGGVMDSVLTTSAGDRGFEPRWSYTKNYIIDIRCLSAKHASLRRKNRDWLSRNQNIVSNWSDISNKN
jgi:hypothetical protein